MPKTPKLSLLLSVLPALALLAAPAAYAGKGGESGGAALTARARSLHQSAIVVDSHIDAPDQLISKWADVATRGATTHFDIPRAREGGLTAPFFSIYVPGSFAEAGGAAKRALELIDLTYRVVEEHPRDMILATSVADIRRAKQASQIAVLMGIEGGHAIEDSLGALRAFYRAGVRYMTLTHTNTNNWADSSGPFYLPDFDPKAAAVHGGLTDFGREVVREMNRLGMIVDISHVGDGTLDHVLAVSRAPVLASHSSCKVLSDLPRNLTDDQIRRIAAKGGVVMINFGTLFLDQAATDEWRKDLATRKPEYLKLKQQYAKDPKKLQEVLRTLWGDKRTYKLASWKKAIEHIEHVMKVAGPDAVGIGSDYDGISDPPEGLEDVSLLPRITEELLRRGHSEEEVRKVLGENFLNLFARVEAVAKSLASEPPH